MLCVIVQQSRQKSLASQPCIAISTLFLQTPTDSTVIYSTYRLIPLSIVSNEQKYIYSNLPVVVAVKFNRSKINCME